MSKATKRKHVTKEVLDDYYVPENNEEIAKVLGGRGNNLHEVQRVNGESFLASMPSKFRKSVWIKRGDYVIITPISEGNKVQAEIVYVLFAKQIKYLKDEGQWPTEFDENGTADENTKDTQLKASIGDQNESEEEDLLVPNTNRPNFMYCDDEDTSSEDDDQNEAENTADDASASLSAN